MSLFIGKDLWTCVIKKVPWGWGSLTMMKDVSLMKKGAVGENLFYKVQDFLYDDVLFEYCKTMLCLRHLTTIKVTVSPIYFYGKKKLSASCVSKVSENLAVINIIIAN